MPSHHFQTLVELLRYRANQRPDYQVYTFLTDAETESGCLTYQQLDLQARAIAAQIQSRTTFGDRALVVYPYTAGLEFIAAFFGCLYAGIVAVTDHPPRNGNALTQLEERVVSSKATIALTTQEFLNKIQALLAANPDVAPQLNSMTWVATDAVPITQSIDWVEPNLEGNSLAFLQYTSGSTGIPKGVMVTHANILHNCAVLCECFEHQPESRGLSWLPLFHDMGLIGGVMQPVYADGPTLLMSPISFIQNPLSWLQAISRWQITVSGAPNFAYELLCDRVTAQEREWLDLSQWQVASVGAEPVRAETLERFARTFKPCGFRREAFYPCYGMAETTLIVSGGAKTGIPTIRCLERTALAENRVVIPDGEQFETKEIVGCGWSRLGTEIRIVDPDRFILCPPGQVGEIWIAGESVGLGYWDHPKQTEETFKAYLSDTGEGPFLRTGDLGFIHDQELFITGRLKDLMILWGRNHYPHQIEATIDNCHPALRSNSGAAFSVEVAGEERLAIVHEVERSFLRNLDSESVIEAIRQAVMEEHIAEVYAIVLLKTGSIPKTSSGKIQRQACKAKFLENSLDAIGQWRSQLPSGRGLEMLNLGNV